MNKMSVIDFELSNLVENQYGKYAKYVILDRALPNINDGLKPVQRRVLYACYKLLLFYNKPYKKSVRVVGEVIAKYHPHGDISVYNAMLRMSQEWKMRLPLIKTQGNNGSIDGDSPAAMRYTEVKLSEYAHFLLDYIPYNTVDYIKNFDDSEIEPIILPTIVPNLLINGAIGIAAGYATDIHPHNPCEVIDGVILRIQRPNCFLSDILKKIKGPDYPTGGLIIGGKNALKGYRTGNAKFIIRSRVELINNSKNKEIIITELPFGVVKSNLTRQIEMLRLSDKFNGIKEVRDESNFEGIRVVIVIKPSKSVDYIYKYLLKNTQLQINSNYNMVAIKNNKPALNSLLTMIDAFIKHLNTTYTKLFKYKLEKCEKKLEIINGFIIIINNIKEVVDLLLKSKSKDEAKNILMIKYKLNERQTNAILQMQLRRLTSSNVEELKIEGKKNTELVNFYTKQLSSSDSLNNIIINNLNKTKAKLDSPRKTEIISESEEIVLDESENFKNNPVTILTTQNGYYFKSNSFVSFDSIKFKENEIPADFTYARNKEVQTWFTNGGNFFSFECHRLSKNKEEHLNKIVKYNSENNNIILSLTMNKKWNNKQCFAVTKNGYVKRFNLSDFENKETLRISKIIKLNEDDLITKIFVYKKNLENDKKVFLLTKNGYALSFKVNDVSLTKIRSGTVKGFKLKNDKIIAGFLYEDDIIVKLVNNKFQKKAFNANNYEDKTRTSYGYKIIKKESDKYLLFGFSGEENITWFLRASNNFISWDKRNELETFEKIKKFETNDDDGIFFNSLQVVSKGD